MVPGHMEGAQCFFFYHFIHGYEEVAKYEGILGKKQKSILLYGNSGYTDNNIWHYYGVCI